MKEFFQGYSVRKAHYTIPVCCSFYHILLLSPGVQKEHEDGIEVLQEREVNVSPDLPPEVTAIFKS